MYRVLAAVVVVGGILVAARSASAGDEVDYSAPYITVEDGELVTKYPNREHEQAAQQPDGSPTVAVDSLRQPRPTPRTPWVVVFVAITAAVGLLLIIRRRRSTPTN